MVDSHFLLYGAVLKTADIVSATAYLNCCYRQGLFFDSVSTLIRIQDFYEGATKLSRPNIQGQDFYEGAAN